MKKFLISAVNVFLFFIGIAQTSKDTINSIDSANLKQGHWVIYNKTKHFPNYSDNQIVEEGYYINDKKEGIWKRYWNNGKILAEVTYNNNIQSGYAKIYYKNGNISEEGNWENGKWSGNYKLYDENGQLIRQK